MAVILLPPAVEMVPRLWLGSNVTCDVARRDLNFVCINVGMLAHTNDPRCNFIPICNTPDGTVSHTQLVAVQRLLINAFGQPSATALLHCADGFTYSPLAMSLWLQQRYNLTLNQAYNWVMSKQPRTQDLRSRTPVVLMPPVQGAQS